MKRHVLFLIFIISSSILFSQSEEPLRFDRSRLFTGGNLGLQFGNFTTVDVSPILGYFFTDRIALGVGVIYQYHSYKDRVFPALSYKTNIYGAKVFARYYIIESIFAHAEYEGLSLETDFFDPSNLRHQTERFLVHNVLLGVGYRQAIGAFSGINLMLLYNINETVDTPYRNPILRMGVDIGF